MTEILVDWEVTRYPFLRNRICTVCHAVLSTCKMRVPIPSCIDRAESSTIEPVLQMLSQGLLTVLIFSSTTLLVEAVPYAPSELRVIISIATVHNDTQMKATPKKGHHQEGRCPHLHRKAHATAITNFSTNLEDSLHLSHYSACLTSCTASTCKKSKDDFLVNSSALEKVIR